MINRRRFINGVVHTAALIASAVRGSAAKAKSQATRTDEDHMFTAAEAATFSGWCDMLVIGAADAGVTRFVDQNIDGSFGDSMLLFRYLRRDQLAEFYHKGIAGIEQECLHRFETPFAQLDEKALLTIVEAAAASKTQAWKSPDPSLFYFISRSDAVDVVYGTQAGFARLEVPYLAHVEPPRPW